MASGLGSVAWAQEGTSPCLRDKLGVSLFPETGEELEPPGYCVCSRVHGLPSRSSVLGTAVAVGERGRSWESRRDLGCSPGLVCSHGRPPS